MVLSIGELHVAADACDWLSLCVAADACDCRLLCAACISCGEEIPHSRMHRPQGVGSCGACISRGAKTRKKKCGHLWGIHDIIRGMKESFIKTQLVEGARDEFVTENVRIILPCDLPVKVFTGGRVVTIDSGEAMVIPAGTVLGIFSSYKRREIVFDFNIIAAEPAFSFMLPVFSMPFIVKDEAMDLDRLPGRDTPLGHILPVTGDKKPKKRIKEDEPLSPVKMIEFIYDSCESKGEIFGEIKTSILLKTLFIMLSEDALLALSGKDNAEKVSEEMVGHLSKAIDFINENYYGKFSALFYQGARILQADFSINDFLTGNLDLFYNFSLNLQARLNKELNFNNNLQIKPLDFNLEHSLLRKQGEFNLKSAGINFYPPFNLSAAFEYSKENKLNYDFPVNLIINNEIITKFTLNAEGLLVSGLITEKINNPIQLPLLLTNLRRKAILDGSYINLYSQNLEKRENLVPLYYFLGLDFNSTDKELRESIAFKEGELIYKAELPNPQNLLPTVIQ